MNSSNLPLLFPVRIYLKLPYSVSFPLFMFIVHRDGDNRDREKEEGNTNTNTNTNSRRRRRRRVRVRGQHCGKNPVSFSIFSFQSELFEFGVWSMEFLESLLIEIQYTKLYYSLFLLLVLQWLYTRVCFFCFHPSSFLLFSYLTL